MGHVNEGLNGTCTENNRAEKVKEAREWYNWTANILGLPPKQTGEQWVVTKEWCNEAYIEGVSTFL
jgi:hypothetical protein